MRKIVPAVLMLLISAMLVGTSTYAWFSMNTKVTVTGMSVSARVSDNILIAQDNSVANDGDYGTSIAQTRSARLAPVSTTDGVAYWYANSQTNVNANGTAKEVSSVKYTKYSEATDDAVTEVQATALDDTAAGKSARPADTFQRQAGIAGTIDVGNVAYGYVDYTFYLKATNASGSASNLNMTYCNILYNGAALGATDKAWRIAVFVQDAVAGSNITDAPTSSNLVTILERTGAAYNTATTAATGTNTTGSVNEKIDDAATIKAVAAGATVYEKVTIRLWMEGEDSTCKNENYANMTANWTLDLAFKFGDTAVLNIGSANLTVSKSTNTLSVDLTDGKLPNGLVPTSYQWYKVGATDSTVGTSSSEYTAAEDGSYYCVVTCGTRTFYTETTAVTVA